MDIFTPYYYHQFRCLAGACPDSCCQEWDVVVDEESARRYRGAEGPLADKLRACLVTEDGETVLKRSGSRCPMWREDGLCRIQCAWGEEALCRTCRDFPRLTHDYGDFVERGLELSCPEAARLILDACAAPMERRTAPGGEAPDYDGDTMAVLRASRENALKLIEKLPPYEALAALLVYGYAVQEQIDGGKAPVFDSGSYLDTAKSLAQTGDMAEILDFYKDLEILTPRWQARLGSVAPQPRFSPLIRPLARYFVERYWLQAVSDYDLVGRVKFCIVSCLVIDQLGGDFRETAQLYSKEIENDADNVLAILDGAYTEPAFADVRLLGLLTGVSC